MVNIAGEDEMMVHCLLEVLDRRRRRLGPYSVQSVVAAEAVSLAIEHNPGQVSTPSQDTSKLALILPTSKG